MVSLALKEEEVPRIISSSSLETLPKCLTGRTTCRVVLSDLGSFLNSRGFLTGAFILLLDDHEKLGIEAPENYSQTGS